MSLVLHTSQVTTLSLSDWKWLLHDRHTTYSDIVVYQSYYYSDILHELLLSVSVTESKYSCIISPFVSYSRKPACIVFLTSHWLPSSCLSYFLWHLLCSHKLTKFVSTKNVCQQNSIKLNKHFLSELHCFYIYLKNWQYKTTNKLTIWQHHENCQAIASSSNTSQS